MNMESILECAVLKFNVNAKLSEAATIAMEKSNCTEIIDESMISTVLEQANGTEKTNILEKIQNIIETVTKFIQTMISKVVEFFSPLEQYYKKNINTFKKGLSTFEIPKDLKIQIVNYEKLNILTTNSIKATMDELIEKAFNSVGLDEKSTIEEIKEVSPAEKQQAVLIALSSLLVASLKGVKLEPTDNVEKIKSKIYAYINEEVNLTSSKDLETAANLIPKYISIKGKINEILSVTRRCRTSMISKLKSKPEGLRFFYGEYAYFFSTILSNIYNIISASCIKSAKACRAVMQLVVKATPKSGDNKEDGNTGDNTKNNNSKPKPGDDDVIDIE